jgi:hypothetical protein
LWQNDHEIYNSVETFLLYITMDAFSFYHRCAVLERISENWSLFGSLYLIPGTPWDQKSQGKKINLCLPCPKYASYENFKKMER